MYLSEIHFYYTFGCIIILLRCPTGGNINKIYVKTIQPLLSQHYYQRYRDKLHVICNRESFRWEEIKNKNIDGIRITELMFAYCDLQSIDDGFIGFFQRININGSELQTFTIKGNWLPQNIFKEMFNLETLDFTDSKLETFPNLDNLEKLQSLKMDSNGLISIPRDAFANNRNLTEISLRANKLKDIENISFPLNLARLNLASNEITSLTFESLFSLTNLQFLNLDYNTLYNLKANAFNDLLELKELSLKSVSFTEFPELVNLVKLERLNIMRLYKWHENFPVEIRDLSNLWQLHIQNLGLTDFPKLKNLSNLLELNLSQNELKTIPNEYLSQFPKLKKLDLSKNRLAELVSLGAGQITDLDLQENQITFLKRKVFVQTKELVRINLSNNGISSIDYRTFEILSNLAWLDLSNNKIWLGQLDSDPFKRNLKLQTLRLRNNRIESIYDGWRISLNHLIELDLRSNNLQYLSAKKFSFTQTNISVLLQDNPISDIDMVKELVHPASYFHNNTEELTADTDLQPKVNIILGNVKTICDCRTLYLKNFHSKDFKIESQNIFCRDFHDSLPLSSVKDKDFTCKAKLGCPVGCDCWQRPADSTVLIDCSRRDFNLSSGPPLRENIENLLDHLTRTRVNRTDWKFELDLSGNNITELSNEYASRLSPQIDVVNLSDNKLTSLSFLHAINHSETKFSLANNLFLCDDCLGFQEELRRFESRLIIGQMTCIFDNKSEPLLKGLDTLQLRFCPRSSNQIHYFIIVAALLILSVLIIIYLTHEKTKRQREMKEIIDLLNGRKTNEGDEDDPLHFLFDSNYEMKKNSFIIDRNCILGRGEFGEVYKGLAHGINKTVAFKTVRSDRGTGTLKALVSEAKIMMYIGQHEHLVTLLGVYREEIMSGILHLAIEFCEFGSLESFLRKNKASFTDRWASNQLVENADANTARAQKMIQWEQSADEFIQSLCNTKSLLMWSAHIASAMEYLGTKNVIHSDLATRNVLLTREGIAKVTDFGLSRRTYSYSEYIKTAKDPLPWRWLAIESLRTNTFSVKSDVWAYGITLWELFSLGDIPYPGMSPTMEFVQELADGLRNFKPKLASNEIYGIMMACWNLCPEERPQFSSLKIIFNYADFNGAESLQEKLSQGGSLDNVALQLATMDYTIIYK